MNTYTLFIDFDFTITTEDVGHRFYTHFSGGRNQPIVTAWLNREISSYTCLTEEARICRGTVAEFASFVDKFEIDPGFGQLVSFCRVAGIPIFILSDGLDFYIERILSRHGYADIPFFANHAEFTEEGLQISLPYWTPDCPSCGNCKGRQIQRLRRPTDRAIYVGDGFSDLCAIRQADLVFAKNDLAKFMRAENLDFIEYKNLFDVAEKLRNMMQTGESRDPVQRRMRA